MDLLDLPPCSREIGRNSEVPFLHELNDSELPPRAVGLGIGGGWEKSSFKLCLCYRPALQLNHTLAGIGHRWGRGECGFGRAQLGGAQWEIGESAFLKVHNR